MVTEGAARHEEVDGEQVPRMTRHQAPVTAPRRRMALAVLTVLLLGTVGGASVGAETTVATIGVGSSPIDVVTSSALGQAFVLNDGSLSIIDLDTRTQIDEVGTGFQDQVAIELVQGDTEAYIATFDLDYLTVFDTTSRTVSGGVVVGTSATGITTADTPGGEFAYVSLAQGTEVVVVDTATTTVTTSTPLPAGAQTITATPDGTEVWVGSIEDGTIWVIDTSTQQRTRTIDVTQAGPVSSIAFSPDGSRAWVSGLGGLSEVDTRTGDTVFFAAALDLFPGGPNMGAVALNTAGTAVMVVDSTFPSAPAQGSVAILDTRTREGLELIELGTEPQGMAVDTTNGQVYVTNYRDDTVSVFAEPDPPLPTPAPTPQPPPAVATPRTPTFAG